MVSYGESGSRTRNGSLAELPDPPLIIVHDKYKPSWPCIWERLEFSNKSFLNIQPYMHGAALNLLAIACHVREPTDLRPHNFGKFQPTVSPDLLLFYHHYFLQLFSIITYLISRWKLSSSSELFSHSRHFHVL